MLILFYLLKELIQSFAIATQPISALTAVYFSPSLTHQALESKTNVSLLFLSVTGTESSGRTHLKSQILTFKYGLKSFICKVQKHWLHIVLWQQSTCHDHHARTTHAAPSKSQHRISLQCESPMFVILSLHPHHLLIQTVTLHTVSTWSHTTTVTTGHNKLLAQKTYEVALNSVTVSEIQMHYVINHIKWD